MLEDILNSKWFLVSLVVAVILIIVATVLRLLTPDEITVPVTNLSTTNIDNTSSSFANIQFTGNAISIPNSFTIAQAQISSTQFQQRLAAIQQQYELQPDQQNGNLWTGPNYVMLFSPTSNTYTLSKPTPATDQPISFQTDSQVTTAAQNIINQLFPDSSLVVMADDLQYQSAGAHLEEAGPEEAAYVTVPFSYQVDGFPVYYQNRFQIPFLLLIDNSFDIHQLRFPNQFLTITPLTQKDSISITEAINNMNTLNKGSIIVSLFTGYEGNSLSEIVGGELTTVSIEYRLDEQTDLLIPFYRFSGSLINERGTTIEAEVITPAIETTSASSL